MTTLDLTVVKDIAAVAAPLTTVIANTFLRPKLEQLSASREVAHGLIDPSLTDKFAEYLTRSYERNSYLRTVVFQNSKRLLDELYVPLTIQDAGRKQSEIVIDRYPSSLLPAHKKVLLVDTAGMGKSTLSRFLFLKAVEAEAGVPLFVELRQLKKGNTILDLIHNDVSAIDEAFSKDLLLKLIRRGDFIFFFDGFDEIPVKEREFATENLQDFISKAAGNLFMMTSRADPALGAFPEFQQFFIKPLQESEAFTLLRKYDPTGEISEPLIAKLRQGGINAHPSGDLASDERLESFLVNPLLVSLLFKAYDFKPTLPLRADVFYRQVYEALFENHDLAKGGSFIREKFSKLNVDDFARVLRVLGMRTLTIGKVEYTPDELSSYVREARDRCPGLAFAEADFIKDLTRTVPLFVQDGGAYRWTHKSFQEYFAALYIAVDGKSDVETMLLRLVNSREAFRFSNVLELYYDIDQASFRRSLTKRVVSEFLHFYTNSYSNFRGRRITKADVAVRRILCFARTYLLLPKEIDPLREETSETWTQVWFSRAKTIKSWCVENGLANEADHVISVTGYGGDGGALIEFGGGTWIIIEVLARKMDPLVLQKDELPRITEMQARSTLRLGPRTLLPGDKPLAITDDPANPLNGPGRFARVNQLLLHTVEVVGIDEQRARTILTEIERMEAHDAVTDFFAEI